MEVKFNRLHWLLWIFVLSGVCSVVIVYVWSVLLGDVPALFPYVSDTGGNAPQSALFGLALIVGSFCAVTSFLVRFYSIKAANSENPRRVITAMNYLSLVSAFLACLGIAMVGINPISHLRRDGTWFLPVLVPHLIATGILFVNAGMYFVIQTSFVWLLGPSFQTMYLGYARLACNLVSLAGAVPLIMFAPYKDHFEDLRPVAEHGSLYKGNSPWSAFGEWVLIFGVFCNILTLVPDMKRVRVTLHIENVVELPEKETGDEMMKL